MCNYKGKKNGTALLSALFIMVLVSIAATAISHRTQIELYKTRMVFLNDKLTLASELVSFWAINVLLQKKFFLYHSIKFPNALHKLYPDVALSGTLTDLQGKFNLNNLSDVHAKQLFLNILKNAEPQLTDEMREQIARSTIDWITPYQPGIEGINDSYYLNKIPPYFPAHQPMQDIGEFSLVEGVTPKLYEHLKAYLIALPEPTAININSASKLVLKSLGRGLTDTEVEQIVVARGKSGIKKLEEIAPLLNQLEISQQSITIESTYFLCHTTAGNSELSHSHDLILKRKKGKNNQINVSLV